MQEFHYDNGTLMCEGVAVSELARRFGTPLYVYSRQSITDHCRYVEMCFGGADHLSCYAVKANANREILRIIAAEGLGADIGSAGELHLALSAGFDPTRITYSGVGKRRDEISQALEKKIMALNTESVEEIRLISSIAAQLGVRAPILLRVNLDIEAGTHPYITTGRKHNKFGIERSQAIAVLKEAQNLPGLDVLGIHIHIGSQIIETAAFIEAAKAVVALVSEIRAAGIPLRHLNFGGGFGVTYRRFIDHPLLPDDAKGNESHVTVAHFLESVLPILGTTGCKILIQPGRSIIAHAGILATEVLYIKRNAGKTFIIADAGMNDLMRPTLYQSYHQIVPSELRTGEPVTADVVGPLCESGDYFALERQLPPMEQSDILAVLCTGAYGFVLSSNYNARPRPAEVLVDTANARLIRERETIEQL